MTKFDDGSAPVLRTSEPLNTPRYAMVRADDRGKPQAYYDIVDNDRGTERVLASNVRFEAARRIVDALNFTYPV